MSFGDSAARPMRESPIRDVDNTFVDDRNSLYLAAGHFNSNIAHHYQPPFSGSYHGHPGFWNLTGDDQLTNEGAWDELRSVVERAVHHNSHVFDCTYS